MPDKMLMEDIKANDCFSDRNIRTAVTQDGRTDGRTDIQLFVVFMSHQLFIVRR